MRELSVRWLDSYDVALNIILTEVDVTYCTRLVPNAQPLESAPFAPFLECFGPFGPGGGPFGLGGGGAP